MTSMSDCHFLCQRREIIDFEKKKLIFFMAFCTFFHSWKNLWNFSISWFIIPNWSKFSKILPTVIHICRGHFLTYEKKVSIMQNFLTFFLFFRFVLKMKLSLSNIFCYFSTIWTLGEISVANVHFQFRKSTRILGKWIFWTIMDVPLSSQQLLNQ